MFPVYEPSPNMSLYVPTTSPVTPAFSEHSLHLLGTESLPDLCSPAVSPPRDLPREGPFVEYSAPSDTGDHPLISEGLYHMTSYDSAEVADVDPAYGLQLHC